KEILDKPGKYTNREYEYVKQHTLLGYKILKDQPLDIRVKRAALMHHERSDGSGYPQGLIDENIDSFAQIVAIADVYDAMTAARSYRAPLCPFQVITAFETEGLQKYHPEYILTFLEHIANTYQHNRVLLSNGHSATIVMINSKNLTKPMIQLDDKSILDMVSRPDLEIIKII
ncbi:MAG: HD domain-containing phosphohydrolase, partial [Lachnospiraceae bacterium]